MTVLFADMIALKPVVHSSKVEDSATPIDEIAVSIFRLSNLGKGP
jgi:hypothetical protein